MMNTYGCVDGDVVMSEAQPSSPAGFESLVAEEGFIDENEFRAAVGQLPFLGTHADGGLSPLLQRLSPARALPSAPDDLSFLDFMGRDEGMDLPLELAFADDMSVDMDVQYVLQLEADDCMLPPLPLPAMALLLPPPPRLLLRPQQQQQQEQQRARTRRYHHHHHADALRAHRHGHSPP